MHIVWDEPKRLPNIDKHELDFRILTEGWFDGAITIETRRDERRLVE